MARSFILNAYFHIINRACDTLILLALAYTKYYPDQPFCPWLLGIEFVKHFFGLVHMILPNFSYLELLKVVQHIMVCQRILLSGNFKAKQENESGVGYILDYDAVPLTPEDFYLALPKLTHMDLNCLVELAFSKANSICKDILKMLISPPSIDEPLLLVKCGAPHPKPKTKKTATSKGNGEDASDADTNVEEEEENVDSDDSDLSDDSNEASEKALGGTTELAAKGVSCMSALKDDYNEAVEEALKAGPIQPITFPSIAQASSNPMPSDATKVKSEIMDANGKVSITLMLRMQHHLKYGTKVHLEKVVQLNPKYVLQRATDITDTDEKMKMSIKEAAQWVRLAQDLANDLERDKKVCKIRWQIVTSGKSRFYLNLLNMA